MKFVSKEIKVHNYTLHYLEWLPPSRSDRTILCVHGYPGSSYDFTRLVKTFKQDYHIISIDLLGSGVSESPEGVHFPIPMHAEYLIEMINILNLKNIILMGHSYGGSICQVAAAMAPECFSCLILLASIGSIPHIAHRKALRVFSFWEYISRMPKFYRLFRPVAQYGFKKMKLSEKMAENENILKVFCRTVIEINFKEIGEYASKVICPTLYISCLNDRFVDPAVRRDLEKKIKHFQYAELQGNSHFLQHTHTTQVKENVAQFLDQVDRIGS